MRTAALWVVLIGCSSPRARSVPMPNNDAPSDASAAPERRATVRIDPKPGGKKFQGVWLELDDGQRWVVDYRPREIWRPFEDAVVRVTGHCYRPFGQAISATHFEVERMRFEAPAPGTRPILEIGREELLRGRLVRDVYPAGSKLAGAAEWRFDAGGESFLVYGAVEPGARAGREVAIKARRVELDPTYAAGPTGPHLWIADVRDADHVEDPAHADVPEPCP